MIGSGARTANRSAIHAHKGKAIKEPLYPCGRFLVP
nr:MAG TPA: hypothetical protein [Bacteriophage sp.]